MIFSDAYKGMVRLFLTLPLEESPSDRVKDIIKAFVLRVDVSEEEVMEAFIREVRYQLLMSKDTINLEYKEKLYEALMDFACSLDLITEISFVLDDCMNKHEW